MSSSDVNIYGSLRNRLVLTLIGGVAVLTLLSYFVIRNYAVHIAVQSQDSILRASVTSILDAATLRDGSIEIDIPYAAFSMLGTATDDRIFYVIYQDELVLSGYKDLKLPKADDAFNTTFRSTHYRNVPIRQVSASRTLIGANQRTIVTASIAQTQDSLDGALKQISVNVAIYGFGFFTLAVLLSIWVSSSTISPLKRLADSVARRGPQDLSPVAKPVPTEMAPLVSSLNHFMERLESSLKQSEDFIAEAAHRVRTPIATVRSHAELTLQRVDKEENRHALRSMIRAIDETSRAAGQLLDHAMISFRSEQHEYSNIDLAGIARDTVLRLTPVAEMKDIIIRLDADSKVLVPGDTILLQNSVRNLVDNAPKYSPSDSTIVIEVRNQPTLFLEVRDKGPGFQTHEMATLTDRFTRGVNAGGTIGSGLGLTIARDVAKAHNGFIELSNNISGGACVTLSF